MFPLQFLHSFGRNILVWFAPIVFIIFSLNLNLPNAELHKQVLKSNNFYNQFSQEAYKISKSSNLSTIVPQINSTFADPAWLRINTESTIDNFTSWFVGQKDVIETPQSSKFELPESLNSIKNQLQNSPNAVDTSQLKTLASSYGLNLEDFKKQITNMQKDKLGNNNLDLLNQNWLFLPKIIRGLLLKIQNSVPVITVIYVLLLLLVAGVSPFFGKKPLVELGAILFKVGSSTLISSAVALIGILITIYSSGFVQGSFLSFLQTQQITSIINWQIFWLVYNVLATAIWIGVGSLFGSLALNRIFK